MHKTVWGHELYPLQYVALYTDKHPLLHLMLEEYPSIITQMVKNKTYTGGIRYHSMSHTLNICTNLLQQSVSPPLISIVTILNAMQKYPDIKSQIPDYEEHMKDVFISAIREDHPHIVRAMATSGLIDLNGGGHLYIYQSKTPTYFEHAIYHLSYHVIEVMLYEDAFTINLSAPLDFGSPIRLWSGYLDPKGLTPNQLMLRAIDNEKQFEASGRESPYLWKMKQVLRILRIKGDV